MRMPHMTTRRWMAVVAVVAVVLGGVNRWFACVNQARLYESQRWLYRSLAQTIRGDGISSDMHLNWGLTVGKGWAIQRGVTITDPSQLENLAAGFDRLAREREQMRRRCLRAIYCVWDPLPPPPPQFAP